jgi:hypothetical protein
MKRTGSLRMILILFAGFVTLGLWIQSPMRVQAQCGDTPADSSCKTCHEKSAPVYGTGEWHDIHAGKDCCWNCHGGNTQVLDKDLAHEGMVVNPLQDVYTDCHACHPDDYQMRAERFGAALGISISSSEPPSRPEPLQSKAQEGLQLIILPTPEPVNVPAMLWHPEIGLVLLACLVSLGFFLIERHRVQN